MKIATSYDDSDVLETKPKDMLDFVVRRYLINSRTRTVNAQDSQITLHNQVSRNYSFELVLQIHSLMCQRPHPTLCSWKQVRYKQNSMTHALDLMWITLQKVRCSYLLNLKNSFEEKRIPNQDFGNLIESKHNLIA